MATAVSPANSNFGASSVNKQLLSDLGILKTETYDLFVKKYPEIIKESYIMTREAQGALKFTPNQDYYHYEELGREIGAFTVGTGATGSAAGVNVTITIDADDHWNSGASSLPVAKHVFFNQTNGQRYQVIAKTTTSAGAHTVEFKPVSSTATASIAAGDVLSWEGVPNAGEASTRTDGTFNREEKITNYTTTIRLDKRFTDYAMMTRDDVPDTHYYHIREMKREYGKFAYVQERELAFGEEFNNLGSQGNKSHKGLIPQIKSKGMNFTGSSSIDATYWTNMTDKIYAEGGPAEYDILMDEQLYNKSEAFLATTYTNGAVLYEQAFDGAPMEINRNFKAYNINGVKFNFNKYAHFSAPRIVGMATGTGFWKNKGILIPRGSGIDAKGQERAYFRIRYWAEKEGDSPIKVLDTGGWADRPTNNEMYREITHYTNKGVDVFAANTYGYVALS